MAGYFTWAGVAYLVAQMQAEAAATVKYIQWHTAGTCARTATHTTFTEGTESPRATATLTKQTTSQTDDTLQAVATITCNATGKTITSAGLYTSSTLNAATLVVCGDFTGIPVVQNDQIQFTFKLQYT